MQTANDVQVSRVNIVAGLRRILPRKGLSAAVVTLEPAGVDMLRVCCGPAREEMPILSGFWRDPAQAPARALRAIVTSRKEAAVRLTSHGGILMVDQTTVARPKAPTPPSGPPPPPLADLPLFSYRPPPRG